MQKATGLVANLLTTIELVAGQDLNLRPSGYEPDELPDCSTPRLICLLCFVQRSELYPVGFMPSSRFRKTTLPRKYCSNKDDSYLLTVDPSRHIPDQQRPSKVNSRSAQLFSPSNCGPRVSRLSANRLCRCGRDLVHFEDIAAVASTASEAAHQAAVSFLLSVHHGTSGRLCGPLSKAKQVQEAAKAASAARRIRRRYSKVIKHKAPITP